ncbi:2Fe-2S iron-sulfur cluster-binding protein [Desulforhopalus singaporensis]|uniref:2Fe-2S iron-sulfur cluster binding domain-containing protein n=1 Tax=Desulforhopalus singaporensis TaxID=91360 RepID=A0A1H0KJL5_9BACT|nr:2Fe-2S iron-sulfur cluster-binding protein [Desulforhopalus singaporensis]SDO55912.1 2Fe-2S iron-sulfur cluster binding domain-containing protein [Desulforhopalus singaporensis]
MFKRDQHTDNENVAVILDGETTNLPGNMSVAASLLSEGRIVAKISPASKKPCSPHCLMGVCYECLMEIDGVKQQACMVEIQEGMVINRRLGTMEED